MRSSTTTAGLRYAGNDRPEPTSTSTRPRNRSDADPDQQRRELAGCLTPLLARLPAIYRDALQLTDVEGLTQVEAADRVGLSVSGMKTRVQRGRHQLKTLLEQCCEIAVDRRGGVADYQPHTGPCACHT